MTGQELRGPGIARGTPAYRRANIAMVLAAFATFASLYSVQPLLPIFSDYFGHDAGTSSLSLSLTTITLAGSLLVASWVADRIGRKVLLVSAMVSTAALGLVLAVAPDWETLLLVRALMGVTLSGLPAVAMVYLAEEMDAEALGPAMGLYVAGTAAGGMAGRLLSGVMADLLGWRMSLGILGTAILLVAVVFAALLPRPVNSSRSRLSFSRFVANVGTQFRDAGLPWLFSSAFLLMGSFVTLYNYAGYRLALPPFSLSHTAISAIFVVYLLGSVSSAIAGNLSVRFGRRYVYWVTVLVMSVGVVLTALPWTAAVIAGLAATAIGFFAAHGIASAWVARRAVVGRAQASALYLFMYYLGSSLLGTLGGFAWVVLGWGGVMLVTGGAMALAMVIAMRLFHLPPLPVPEKPPAVSPGV